VDDPDVASTHRPPYRMPSRHRLTALLALALAAAPAAHGQASRARVSAAHTWLQLTDEHRLDPKWALSADVQVRRADLAGHTPQQLEARFGLVRDVGGGARMTLGYMWQHSAIYGELPAAAPTREHEVWEQLQFGSRTGHVAWSHRFRLEQRWIHPLVSDDAAPTIDRWQYRNRFRLQERATVDATALGLRIPRAYLTAHGELFFHLGWTPEGQVFDQSRLAAQAGYRLTPRFRVEAGYMQQLIQRGTARATEVNHTLLVGVSTTTGR
jgi:hypothetical protein